MNPMARHIFREIGTDRLLDISMVGVEENSRGQGVATNLIQRSILLGGCLGYRGIMAQPTSRSTVLQPAYLVWKATLYLLTNAYLNV